MILRNICNEEVASLRLAPLISWLNNGITKLEWCFVLEDNSDILGKIVYGVFDNELEILYIDMGDAVNQELLYGSLKEMKLKGFKKTECDLYSDKKNFELYVKEFLSCGFKIIQRKKSIVWEQGKINQLSGKLYFRSLEDTDEIKYIDAIEKVTEDTLDNDDIECVTEYGSKRAAEKYFNQLKDIDYNKAWWKLAYTYDNELAGLVVPQKFNENTGAVNYIGVVPEKRGNGFVNDLLIEAVTILRQDNIKKIIADIDENNYPMEKALYNQDFRLDCTEVILKLDMEHIN